VARDNVQIVKEVARLYEAGDRESWRRYFDPEVDAMRAAGLEP
jgi:hypothetical protein